MGNTINQDVVIWARGQLGKKVGTGECADFADKALIQAGAKSVGNSKDGVSRDLSDADYVWGDEVRDLKDALPGDILQFRDFWVKTTTKTETVTVSAGKTTRVPSAPWTTRRMGHHTAIINAVWGAGLFEILHQNAPPLGQIVQCDDLYTKNTTLPQTQTQNSVRAADGSMALVTIVETTTKEVGGIICAYRPMAK